MMPRRASPEHAGTRRHSPELAGTRRRPPELTGTHRTSPAPAGTHEYPPASTVAPARLYHCSPHFTKGPYATEAPVRFHQGTHAHARAVSLHHTTTAVPPGLFFKNPVQTKEVCGGRWVQYSRLAKSLLLVIVCSHFSRVVLLNP